MMEFTFTHDEVAAIEEALKKRAKSLRPGPLWRDVMFLQGKFHDLRQNDIEEHQIQLSGDAAAVVNGALRKWQNASVPDGMTWQFLKQTLSSLARQMP